MSQKTSITNNLINEKKSVSREELYSLAWSEPMTKIALRYDVSSSFLARIYKRLNVPRPPPGYWAKIYAGRKIKVMPLPIAKLGDELEWVRDLRKRSDFRELLIPSPKNDVDTQLNLIDSSSKQLIQGSEKSFQTAKETKNGFLRPSKRLLLDIVTSKRSYKKALAISENLFKTLEQRGHRVVISPRDMSLRRTSIDQPLENFFCSTLWTPERPTVVFVGNIAIGITLFEMTHAEEMEFSFSENKKHMAWNLDTSESINNLKKYESFTRVQHWPSGKFCLRIYSPYLTATWKKEWSEKTGIELKKIILEIVEALEASAHTIAKLIVEGKNKAENDHFKVEKILEEVQKKLDVKRQANVDTENLGNLSQIIDAWNKEKLFKEFLQEVESFISNSNMNSHQKHLLTEKIESSKKIMEKFGAIEKFTHWEISK